MNVLIWFICPVAKQLVFTFENTNEILLLILIVDCFQNLPHKNEIEIVTDGFD